jgi:hypothetical protein
MLFDFLNKKRIKDEKYITFTQEDYNFLIQNTEKTEQELREEIAQLKKQIIALEKQKNFLWRKCQILISEKQKNI